MQRAAREGETERGRGKEKEKEKGREGERKARESESMCTCTRVFATEKESRTSVEIKMMRNAEKPRTKNKTERVYLSVLRSWASTPSPCILGLVGLSNMMFYLLL